MTGTVLRMQSGRFGGCSFSFGFSFGTLNSTRQFIKVLKQHTGEFRYFVGFVSRDILCGVYRFIRDETNAVRPIPQSGREDSVLGQELNTVEKVIPFESCSFKFFLLPQKNFFRRNINNGAVSGPNNSGGSIHTSGFFGIVHRGINVGRKIVKSCRLFRWGPDAWNIGVLPKIAVPHIWWQIMRKSRGQELEVSKPLRRFKWIVCFKFPSNWMRTISAKTCKEACCIIFLSVCYNNGCQATHRLWPFTVRAINKNQWGYV